MDAERPPAAESGSALWRVQSGPMLHIGRSADGSITWQKSAVTGAGRLQTIHLHVVATIDSGRVYAEIDPEGTVTVSTFLKRAIREGKLGPAPEAIVFPRDLTQREPEVLGVAAEAGSRSVHATNAFKQRQKISRHFEAYLADRLRGHSLLGRMENMVACLPGLIAAWNESGQLSDADITRRYLAGAAVVRERLGPDPRKLAEGEFRERRMLVTELRLVAGAAPNHHFVDGYGDVIGYAGYDLTFATQGSSFRAPIFSRDLPGPGRDGPPLTLKGFNPEALLVERGCLPAELRSEWGPDHLPARVAAKVPAVLRAMLARGTARSEIAGFLRELLARWIGPVPQAPAPSPAEVQPAAELRAAGISLLDGSWERIRERHFWRALAHWSLQPGLALGFARVQVESNGRVDILQETPFYAAASQEMNDLLRALFLESRDLVVPPAKRVEIVAELKQRELDRAKRRP